MIEIVPVGGVERDSLDYISSEIKNLFGSCRVSEAVIEHGEYNSKLYMERAVKEAVRGLAHCQDTGCVMVFSDSILGVDRKTMQFCERCRR